MMHSDTADAVLRKLLQRTSIELADYSIAFAKLLDHSNIADAELAGSGTLISVDGRYAVLTADHVLDNLPNSGEIGLVLPTRFGAHVQRVTLDMQLAQKIPVARGQVPEDGPDIGVLMLPDPVASTIKVSKAFYQIDGKDSEGRIPVEHGFWLICGMAHEWTSDADAEAGYQKVKIFRGICGAGVVDSEQVIDGFDYLHFQTKYDEAYEGPESYGGLSGGGLWQIFATRMPSGDLVPQKKILSGVVFYQSALEDHRRTIVCHGRQSVYGAVADKVRNAA